MDLEIDIKVPFTEKREAEIVYNSLVVDKEPPRSHVKKELTLESNILKIHFTAPTAKQLRVGVNGFLDYLLLVTETLNEFGPAVSSEYNYYYS